MGICLVLASGGVKSAVAAALSAAEHELVFLHVDYGQPAARVQRQVLQTLAATFPRSRVMGVDLPYVAELARQGAREGTLPASEAPGKPRQEGPSYSLGLRGLIPVITSVGAQVAARLGAVKLVTGLTEAGEDGPTLLSLLERRPGQAREFVYAFNMMMETVLGARSSLRLTAPLVDLTYAEAVKLGMRTGLAFEHTRSCEGARPTACGRCAGCKARDSAFVEARLDDPASPARRHTSDKSDESDRSDGNDQPERPLITSPPSSAPRRSTN